MNVEFIEACGKIVEKFGFPVFVGMVFMLLIFILLRFFTEQIKDNTKIFHAAIEKKDCDFLGYAEKRDGQITAIVESHNVSFEKNSLAIRENTLATHRLRESVESRIRSQTTQNEILTEVNQTLQQQES